MKKSSGKKKKIIKSLIVATGTGALLSSAAVAGAVSDSPTKHPQSRNTQIMAQKDTSVLYAAVKKKVAKKKVVKKKVAKKKVVRKKQ